MIAPRIALLVAALVLAAPLDLPAQQAALVAPGKRVRVTTASFTCTGTVLESKSDTLVLDIESRTAPVAIAVVSITRLDVSLGRESNVFTGVGIGLLAGAATGVVLGFASGDDPANQFMGLSAEEKAAIGALAFGLTGAVVGGVIGWLVRSERWEVEYPLESVRVGLRPHGADGLAVFVSAAF